MISCFFKAEAQERIIAGVIKDAQTGAPLFSCSIYSLNSGNGVITDEDGKYTLVINNKTDSIAISMIGFKTMVKPVSKAPNQVINFDAEPASKEMQGVVVSVKVKYTKAQRLIINVIKNKNANDVFNNKTFQARYMIKWKLT